MFQLPPTDHSINLTECVTPEQQTSEGAAATLVSEGYNAAPGGAGGTAGSVACGGREDCRERGVWGQGGLQ